MVTISLGLIGGYVGTKIMEPGARELYHWESVEDRQQEDAIRPSPPYETRAKSRRHA